MLRRSGKISIVVQDQHFDAFEAVRLAFDRLAFGRLGRRERIETAAAAVVVAAVIAAAVD